jgi:hypothetical protein
MISDDTRARECGNMLKMRGDEGERLWLTGKSE